MGEAKRKRDQRTPREIAADTMTQRLADDGNLIAAGWIILRTKFFPEHMTEQEEHRLRFAYMAGAQHLWASAFGVVGDDDEPSDLDMERMTKIALELETFADSVAEAQGLAMMAMAPAAGRA